MTGYGEVIQPPDQGFRILLVDDDAEVRQSLTRALVLHGFRVGTANNGLAALTMLATDIPDAVILDVSMPKLDGLEVCRRLRSAGDSTPVLMLTARETIGDRVAGLDAGADDYLLKPFALDELLARLRALIRRAGPAETQLVLSYGNLTLDTGTRQVARAGRPIELTRTEFSLLELLLRHPGQVLTRDVISIEVWNYAFGPVSNSIDVYIRYLRRKTEATGERRLIQTVRGVGYVLREP